MTVVKLLQVGVVQLNKALGHHHSTDTLRPRDRFGSQNGC